MLLLVAFASTPTALVAQHSVDPNYVSQSVVQNGAYYVSFDLVNNDPFTWTPGLSCAAQGQVTSCSLDPSSISVPGISDAPLNLNYTTGAPGTGRITVTVGDVQVIVDITVTAPQPPPYVVSPKGGSVTTQEGQTRRAAFTITNNSPSQVIAKLVPNCSGSAIDPASCVTSSAGLFLRAGESTSVSVRYTTLTAAGTGTVGLRWGDPSGVLLDTGYVTVTVPTPSLAVVSLAASAPRVTADKSTCVSFSLRREVAAECGVLRITHAVPSVRTRNTTRVPTLVYYSDLGYRHGIIGVDVTMAPATTYQSGDSVRVSISRRTGSQCVNPESKTYSAAPWFTGTPGARSRRVGVSVVLDSTGNSYIRQYCLDATLLHTTGSQALAPTQYGEFAVVQRYSTPFGAGWWLAGLEELYLGQPDSIGGANSSILWIGGDASTRRYRCPPSGCTGVYYPDKAVAYKDSLVLSGGQYTRYLPHGLRVVFDAKGRHLQTINRQGAVTTFTYNDTTRQLLSVGLPPAGSGLSYSFVYDGSGLLLHVDAPGTSGIRSLMVQRLGKAITSLTDPDGRAVAFAPSTAPGASPTVIDRVVDRGHVATDFFKETGFATVASVRTMLSSGSAQWQYFRTAWALSAAPTSVQPTPDSLGEAYLRVTDGRGNVTKIWTDTTGAPIKITNPVGNTTTIERGDPRWAGVATKVVMPNGYTTSAQYDAHGNLAANYASNPLNNLQDNVTRYHWDLKWDFADSIVTPSGLTTVIAYDATNGNRLWQQTGPDAARRVNFTYYTTGAAAGLLKSVVPPGTPSDTLFYDAVLGNQSSYKTARGFLTQYFNDAIGRTYETRQQVDTSGTTRMLKVTTTYDLMSRDTMTVTTGLAVSDPVAGVRHTLNQAGDDSLVTRWTAPDTAHLGNLVTRMLRDSLGRVVKLIAPDGAYDSTAYDAAGNVTQTIDRNGDSIVFAYDSVNRMRRRSTSLKHFAPEIIGLARGQLSSPDPVEAVTSGDSLSQSYPWGQSAGYDVAAVVDTFVYSPTDGTLTDANNSAALIHYTYYNNGLLHTEQNSIFKWSCQPPNCLPNPHVYADTISYDVDGRRTSIRYPSVITPNGNGGNISYYYSSYGDLYTVAGFDSYNSTHFTYTSRGEPQQTSFPGGATEKFTYDADGNVRSDTLRDANSNFQRGATFTYDARGSRLGMAGSLYDWGSQSVVQVGDAYNFDVLGQLVASTNTAGQNSRTTTYTLDGLGNIAASSGAGTSLSYTNDGFRSLTSTSNSPSEWSWFIPSTGRLWYSKNVQNADTTGQGVGAGGTPASMNHYDAAGNLIWTGDAILRLDADGHADAQSERRMYYGPDGKLRAVDARAVYYIGPKNPPSLGRGFAHSFEEYRYDALGRRVATRTAQECDYSSDYNLYNPACHVSSVRRTIWDGQRELGEIQVPLEQAENDTYAGQGTITASSINLAPFYGAVAYIYDGRLDQPLGITRLQYSNLTTSNTIAAVAPYTFYPIWDIHGKVPEEYHPVLPASECPAGSIGGAKGTCIFFVYHYQWLPYRDASNEWQFAWHGSLLADNAGAGGLMYRRNRYYDSKTGRFTQEDPIGLTGGLNLYGFAKGDPVNFSDPFGLCPPCDNWTPAEEDYELRMAHEGAKHPGLAVAAAGIMLGGTGMAFLGGSSVGMVAARFAPAGVVVGKGTDKLIGMLEEAGPSMDSRIQAVSRWLPAGQRALMTPLEGGARMLSGGAGERARQIILQTNGETVIKALNVTKKTYEVIATIRPK